MASSQKKSTSGKRSASSGGTRAKSGAKRPPQKQPVRREVGAGVLLVLTLCVFVSYFHINALFIETNPIPIKEAMNLVGMNVGGYRMPLCPMEEDTKAKLIETMKAIDLL